MGSVKISFNNMKSYMDSNCYHTHKKIWQKIVSEDLDEKVTFTTKKLEQYLKTLFKSRNTPYSLRAIGGAVLGAVLHKVYKCRHRELSSREYIDNSETAVDGGATVVKLGSGRTSAELFNSFKKYVRMKNLKIGGR